MYCIDTVIASCGAMFAIFCLKMLRFSCSSSAAVWPCAFACS